MGDTVANEDMRISLGNFGGSFWFRAATDGNTVCSAAGNGAGESVDKFLQTFELQLEMVANDKAVNAALEAYLVDKTAAHLTAYTDATAQRGTIAKGKASFRSKLSVADAANSNSAIHCASLATGSTASITQVTGESPVGRASPLSSPSPHTHLVPSWVVVVVVVAHARAHVCVWG